MAFALEKVPRIFTIDNYSYHVIYQLVIMIKFN